MCSCNTGYTNVGTETQVVCKGRSSDRKFSFNTNQACLFILILDSCEVDNGRCGNHAICSHETSTFAVVCTCDRGYTNIGVAPKFLCEGFIFSEYLYFLKLRPFSYR